MSDQFFKDFLIWMTWILVIAFGIFLFAKTHRPGPHDNLKPPHWVRCDWEPWTEPHNGVFEHIDLEGGRFKTTRSIQRRTCRVCQKVQVRRTDGKTV